MAIQIDQLRAPRGRVLVSVVSALASLVVAASVAPAASADPISLVSPNWAGYAVTQRSDTPTTFTQVQGSWTEPAVTCGTTGMPTAAAIWVGLGGFIPGATGGEQIGTSANCSANGRPSYSAWFELLPYIAYPIKARIHPGDAVSASVGARGDNVVLRLRNSTRHWTVTKTLTWATPDLSSAEWIVEAPGSCHQYDCTSTRLADFGSVTMSGLATSTTAGSRTPADADWTLSAISLVPGPATSSRIADTRDDDGHTAPAPAPDRAAVGPGASPGPLSPDGSSFTIAVAPPR